MPQQKQLDDAVVVEEHLRHKSIYKAAERIGCSPQTVHKIVTASGISCNGGGRSWTEEDDKRLDRDYVAYRDLGLLQDLAADMGRTKHFICQQAKRLGLTDPNAKKRYNAIWKYMPEHAARKLMDEFKHSRYNLREFCSAKGFGVGFWQKMSSLWPDEWDAVIESKARITTKYRRGRQFEYRVRDDLKKKGYFVLRSPQSKSPLDLLAVKTGVVAFIQCKVGGALPPKEWNELIELALSVGTKAVLAARYSTGERIRYKELLETKIDGRHGQPWRDWRP